jgi:CheY-like chemotaxis protein
MGSLGIIRCPHLHCCMPARACPANECSRFGRFDKVCFRTDRKNSPSYEDDKARVGPEPNAFDSVRYDWDRSDALQLDHLGRGTRRVDLVHQQGAADPQQRLSAILVVEDELFVRFLISDALRDAGYEVFEAFNADEALDILDSGVTVDLVFSDVRMPGSIDGLGLLAHVRTNSPDLPVLITSGHLPADLALADGATQFLAKPYLIEHAIKLVSEALAKSL